MKESLEAFRRRYAAHHIPEEVTGMLWKALRLKTDRVFDEVAVCPSFVEYCSAISHLPKDSAAGISGLSYNMKILPPTLSRAMYEAVAEIWRNREIPQL